MIIIGGNSSVDESIQKDLLSVVKDVTRIDGADRYVTSSNIAKMLK